MNQGERVNLPKGFKVYEYSLPFLKTGGFRHGS
jgi:hypothetical protein